MKAQHHFALVGVLASLGLIVASCAQDGSEQGDGADPGAVLDTSAPDKLDPGAVSDCSPGEAQDTDESDPGCVQGDDSDAEVSPQQDPRACKVQGLCWHDYECCTGICKKWGPPRFPRPGHCEQQSCKSVGQYCAHAIECCSHNCWYGKCQQS
jgi:hypothetical protein